MSKAIVKQKKKIRWKKVIPVYLMLLPAMIYFLINNYLPMYGITIAFRKLDYKLGILRSPFNGLENFKFLFASGNLGPILRNTILYNLVFMVIGTVLPITVAILFNEIRNKWAKKTYQTMILVPHLMSMVIVSYLVFAFLSADTGFINKSIIEPLTGNTISFYQEKKYWPFILTFVHQWKGIGFSMVLYLSTILGISIEYYEAAKVDGATKWQQIRHVTLPLLKPTVITMLILSISKICMSDFGLFYQVPKNSGTLYSVTQTIDTYVYNALMNQNNIAMSSAASVLQAIVGFILIIAANAFIRKTSKENAIF
ncbi:ABC transporter permease [Lachnotalea sp. AF33-28]|uniref:ABC transporter permease n=1 Tax=Lachnotalea sp. AF33-28 TaxID=2292046 RepID=UPI000E4B1366|nr:ABC transporter permease subunit [Lachnotalea sp. AF33-28]RHP34344.1 sugar ABC transporter permease [Lachnotalea sp. AF33-28]